MCRRILFLIASVGYVFAVVSQSLAAALVFPSASLSGFPQKNKLDSKNSYESADTSFRNFIQSKPDSTIIGELKPNATEYDVMHLRQKIAAAILSIKEMEKMESNAKLDKTQNANDCFIEVTRVESIAGKCHKVNNGLPICQSGNYMAINSDCS